MKKLMIALVAALMVLTGCGSKGSASTLTVAAPASQNGDFVEGFGSNAYDRWATNLMHLGASVFYIDRDTSDIKPNPNFVESHEVTADKEGNKTYTFKIKSGNKYSDGTEVTAKDYVMAMLLRANPAWMKVASMESTGDELVGYEAYSTGESKVFEGVKLIDDNTFSLTIDKANLPYYFEASKADISPEPMHVWFKDAKLNAEGNAFDNTPEEIQAAVEYVSTTERYKPSVVVGPYKMDSYENGTTILVKNDQYVGNYEGEKPSVDKVVIRQVDSNVTVQAIEKGEVDLSPGNIEGEYINKAKELELQTVNYPRNGFGNITLKANKGPTQYKEVRQSIGYMLNRNEFVQKIAGGYGSVVNGPFGLSQWFYKDNKDEIESKLTDYTYNITKANELLDQSIYKFEKDGVTPFDASKASKDYARYDADGNKLIVKHFGSEKNSVTDLIVSQLVPAAEKAGMEYYIEQGEFATLGAYMQGIEENDFNAFNLATSFTSLYDPWQNHSKYVGTGLNWSDVADPELDAAIEKVRRIEPGNREAYSAAVVEYFEIWNDLLFQIPLYSNLYHDIASNRVKGLEKVTPEMDWSKTMEYISIED
ncbi:ABC transporter substrate-binding protein [Erysipelothrix tonsillarum]|uniref:ABC transporter substrate-binding protein n=1 Tax=Erysipelothrix tonsillarum TaxID=38402 RepID=UPI00035C10A6|nr:ABC transporter substrate-binding protein [Erysipelothrix tonsillarum]